jgi:hypothetical protein
LFLGEGEKKGELGSHYVAQFVFDLPQLPEGWVTIKHHHAWLIIIFREDFLRILMMPSTSGRKKCGD